KHEMLLHLLSADILGFHTRYHCQNFLATVDRFVECQIDHEHMTVTLQGRVCQVVPYPISIEWPPRQLDRLPPSICHASMYGAAMAFVMMFRWDWVWSAGISPRGSSSASTPLRLSWTLAAICAGR